jgi:hypothetical protein
VSDFEAFRISVFVASLLFSGCASFVFARFGARALWGTALVQACLAMIGLWSVGMAQTSESPLIISILMVAVGVAAITATVQAIGKKRPLLSTTVATIVGVVAAYAGILAGYVLVMYTY